MGMFDHLVVLDETLQCPHGHTVSEFQTKSFDDPAMTTYLVEGTHVYRVARERAADAAEGSREHWRLETGEAVFQRRHAIEAVSPPGEVVFYTSCSECLPVLIRHDRPRAWGDLVGERQLWVEFRVTFGGGERRIERTSGTRDDLVGEIREEGVRVLRDDEPLAIAHREIREARAAPPSSRRSKRV